MGEPYVFLLKYGCKMGCKFCASSYVDFARNLTAGEIVEQLLAVERDENIKISNVVFMGIRRTSRQLR